MASGSNSNRRGSAQAKIEDKLVVLREFVASGIPDGYIIPTSMNMFREWVDPDRGIKEIGSPSTTNPKLSPHNRAAVSEARGLMQRLRRQADRPKRKSSTLAYQLQSARDSLATANLLNKRLISQLHQESHRADENLKLLRMETRRRILTDEINQELRLQINRLNTGIGPRPI